VSAPVIQSVQFEAPLVNPTTYGLYAATSWTDETGPPRWFDGGVTIRPHNYGGDDASGVWGADWCAQPDDLTESDVKTGVRPAIPDAFDAITLWAYDECDLTEPSQQEVRERVQQNLRLRERPMVEREFSARLLADAGTVQTKSDLAALVGYLEGLIAESGTAGLLHASAELAAPLIAARLVSRTSAGLRSPLGNQWVFGGGYIDGLGGTLAATSLVYGWRGEVTVRDTIEHTSNTFVAIAERSVAVGYELALGAGKVS
jgi:hypothetical protein